MSVAVALDFQFRYYDAGAGRFLQEDPHPGSIGNPITTINKYVYGGNGPTINVDPNGKFFFAAMIIGAAIGGLYAESQGGRFLDGAITGAIIGGSIYAGVVAGGAAGSSAGAFVKTTLATNTALSGSVISGAAALSSAIAGFAIGGLVGAITGSAIGGVGAVVTGGDFIEGAKSGAEIGYVAGAISGGFSGGYSYASNESLYWKQHWLGRFTAAHWKGNFASAAILPLTYKIDVEVKY